MSLTINYKIRCEPEDIPVRGNGFDREVEEKILRDSETNPWAWCTVVVTASLQYEGHTFEGENYLGACSYKDQADFEAGGYLKDMRLDARADLVHNLSKAVKVGGLANKVLLEIFAMDAALTDLLENTAHD